MGICSVSNIWFVALFTTEWRTRIDHGKRWAAIKPTQVQDTTSSRVFPIHSFVLMFPCWSLLGSGGLRLAHVPARLQAALLLQNPMKSAWVNDTLVRALAFIKLTYPVWGICRSWCGRETAYGKPIHLTAWLTGSEEAHHRCLHLINIPFMDVWLLDLLSMVG